MKSLEVENLAQPGEPKSKRLRLSCTLSKTKEGSGEDNLQDKHVHALGSLPQDVMTHILSYFQSDEPRKSCIAHLFRTFARVSKFCEESCYRYIEHNGIVFDIEGEEWGARNYQMISWMIWHEVKIRKIGIHSYYTDLSVSLLLLLLDGCDVSGLEHLSIDLPFGDFMKASDLEKSEVLRCGFPQRIVDYCENVTVKVAEALVLDLIKGKARSLKGLSMHTHIEDLNWGFITAFSGQLQSLSLDIYQPDDTDGVEKMHRRIEMGKLVTNAIANMPNLKFFSPPQNISASIISSSIERLAVRGGFRFLESDCPSLKQLHLYANLNNDPDWLCLPAAFPALERLHLWIKGTEGLEDQRVCNNYQRLGQVIESMTSLTKLKVCGTYLPIKIKSKSLQIVDISPCRDDDFNWYQVEECICPSLRTLKCVKYQIKPVDMEFFDEDAAWRIEEKTLAKDYRFLGVEVPGSCEIDLWP